MMPVGAGAFGMLERLALDGMRHRFGTGDDVTLDIRGEEDPTVHDNR